MKKVIFAITVICYLTATCGVVINFHYCMKKLDSVTFFEAATDTCGKCGMETDTSKGCCHNEIKVVKLEQDQSPVYSLSFELPALEVPVSYTSSFLVSAFFNEETKRHYHNHSPPLLSEQDTYLQNSVFRI